MCHCEFGWVPNEVKAVANGYALAEALVSVPL